MGNTNAWRMRRAGYSAIGALIALILAAAALVPFFAGAGEVFGTINDVLVVVTLGLLVLPIMAVRDVVGDDAGAWFGVLTWAAVAGCVLAAIRQILLVGRVISLDVSFVTGGLGTLPVLGWAIAVTVVAIRSTHLPHRLGWLMAGVLGLTLMVTIAASVPSGNAVVILSVALVGSLAAWLAATGLDLLGRSRMSVA